ncbi:MAG: hypothetical protein JWN70_1877 [Planctomycetaceae bacterium]|nr:hypothetical protein [Planctomycetaceae bacterium]
MEMQQGPLQSPAWFMLFALLVGLGFGMSAVIRFARWPSGPHLKWMMVLLLGIGAFAFVALATFRVRDASGRMPDVITIRGGDVVQSEATEELSSHPGSTTHSANGDVQLLPRYRPRSDDEVRVAIAQRVVPPASLYPPQSFPVPTGVILLLILLGFGVVLGSVYATTARRSLFPWVAISMGCSAVALAVLVLFGYRSVASHSAQVAHATIVDATQVSVTEEASPYNRSTANSAPGVGRSAYSTSSFDAARDSDVSRQSFGLVTIVGIGGILLLVFFFGVGLLTSFAFRRPVTAAAGPVPNTDRTYGWLVVPAICLAVLGALAQPALLPSADTDFARKSAAFVAQQEHTNKVWRELLARSTEPDSDVKNIPDWLKPESLTDQPTLLTKSQYYLLSSSQYSSTQEAENELLPHAAFLVRRAFQETHPWQGPWTVPLALLRERVITKQFIEKRPKTIGKFSGDLYRLHMLVDVSPDACETFTLDWKSQIVQHRLEVLGVLFGWIACVFFAATYYFRRAAHPENFVGWWGQFKISAVTIGLTAAAAWILVDVIR